MSMMSISYLLSISYLFLHSCFVDTMKYYSLVPVPREDEIQTGQTYATMDIARFAGMQFYSRAKKGPWTPIIMNKHPSYAGNTNARRSGQARPAKRFCHDTPDVARKRAVLVDMLEGLKKQ